MTRRSLLRCLRFVALITLAPGCLPDQPTGARSTPRYDLGFDPWAHLPTNPGVVGLFVAPFIFQDIDGMWQDALTNFTYDNDWAGGNNWDDLYSYPLRSYVYASIVETEGFYFVYYSFFHPRDWGGVPYLDQHENDQESILIVVDKQYTSSTWPYGTPVVVETHDHAFPDGPIIRAYRNCTFNGYTISERYESFDGCIKFIWDDRTVTIDHVTTGPHYRTAVYIEAHGHGVSMHTGENLIWDFGDGDGYVYLPGANADVPQYPDGQLQYRLISLLTDELPGQPGSLWKRRLSSGGYCSSSTYQLLDAIIGPFDVPYGATFKACNGNESETAKAQAPWGEEPGGDCRPTGDCVLPGDWHNHGAWTLVRHFSSSRFNWPGETGNRHDTWMYWYNPFAAPEEAPSSVAETGGGSCGSADPYNCSCDPAVELCAVLSSSSTAPGASLNAWGWWNRSPIPLEQFQVNLGDSAQLTAVVQGAPTRAWSSAPEWSFWVAASPMVGLSVGNAHDGGWGYRDSLAEVLVVPAGDTARAPTLQVPAERYPYVTIRVKAPTGAHSFTMRWNQPAGGADNWYSGDVPLPSTDTGWRTVRIYLLGHPGWLPGSVTAKFTLVFPYGAAIDFVAFHD